MKKSAADKSEAADRLQRRRRIRESAKQALSEQRGYDVGHGKPPREYQFQPGISGNPAGRPKGARALRSYVYDELQKLVTITIEGKKTQIPNGEALAKRLLHDGVAQGDKKAVELIIRLEGEARQEIAELEREAYIRANPLAAIFETDAGQNYLWDETVQSELKKREEEARRNFEMMKAIDEEHEFSTKRKSSMKRKKQDRKKRASSEVSDDAPKD